MATKTYSLECDGFALLPGVIDSDTVSSLIADISGTIQAEDYGVRHLTNLVPSVKRFSESAPIRSLVEPVLGPTAQVVRSIFFDKTPDANWKVAWHQDLTIAVEAKIDVPGFGPWSLKDGVVHVQPPASVLEKMVTVRVHLDDCNCDNGPLQVLPRSHQSGKLSAEQIAEFRKTCEPVTCTIRAGGVVLMRPLLLHASSPAREPKHRRVVHLEFAADTLPGDLQWATLFGSD